MVGGCLSGSALLQRKQRNAEPQPHAGSFHASSWVPDFGGSGIQSHGVRYLQEGVCMYTYIYREREERERERERERKRV